METKRIFFAFITVLTAPLLGMQKRPASPGIEAQEIHQKAKIEQEVVGQPLVTREMATAMELASEDNRSELEKLPDELQVYVFSFLTTASGINDYDKLANAAESIRNLMSVNRRFREYFFDKTVNGMIIKQLAQRYTGGNPIFAALVLHTAGALAWLKEYAKDSKNQESIKKELPLQLILAISSCKFDVVNFILKNFTVDLDLISKLYIIRNDDGSTTTDMTLLMLAVRKGCTTIANALIDVGANVNQTNNSGLTALMVAAAYGNAEIVKLLIARGADITAEDDEGHTALYLAGSNDHSDIVEYLLETKIDQQESAEKLLVTAAQNGLDDIIKILLKYSISTNYFDEQGYSALLAAAESGNVSTIKLLIDAKADVNLVEPDIQESALMVAARSASIEERDNYLEIVRLLLNAGARINDVNSEGSTPLILAANLGNTEMVKLLLSFKPQLNIQDSNGNSALMSAAHKGYEQIVTLLLEAGADKTLINHEGQDAAAMARMGFHPDRQARIVGLLESVPSTEVKKEVMP